MILIIQNLSIYNGQKDTKRRWENEQCETNLDVLGELLVALLIVLFVISQLSEEIQALLHQVFADDLQDLALLQHLSGDVQGEILRVHHAFNEV